ncbi:MAG: DUF4350 domain-containing protein [Brevundimonas sp.]|uniref:DUF4350 domain-containing protein n=1 Tax=Brevundimonas sp. TaxID=1871086 RepID=UPI00391AC59A
MKRLALALGLIALAVAAPALAQQQMTDPEFRPTVARPAYAADGPMVVIDGAHRNFHTVDGRYAPFAALSRADGYRVRGGTTPFDAGGLDGVDVLVIANAGQPEGGGSAFTAPEIEAVEAWVEGGGSLLLIADHAPHGAAAEALAARFGVQMGKGYAFAMTGEADLTTNLSYPPEAFGAHPIMAGRSAEERVAGVTAFTGQTLEGPSGAETLLPMTVGAREAPDLPTLQALVDRLHSGAAPVDALGALSTPALPAQALAFRHGDGRVVVLGEAGMLSAQLVRYPDGRPHQRFGMNTAPGNVQFGLNIMHWLSGLLP